MKSTINVTVFGMALGAFLFMGGVAFGTTRWTGNVDGTWENSGNWDAGLPDSADDTFIEGTTNPDVTLSSTQTVKRVLIDNGRTLYVASGGTLTGATSVAVIGDNSLGELVIQNGGTYNRSGTLDTRFNGSFVTVQDGGTVNLGTWSAEGSGGFDISGSSADVTIGNITTAGGGVNAATLNLNAAPLTVTGNMTWDGGGSSALSIGAGSTLNLTGAAASHTLTDGIEIVGGGQVNLSGTLDANANTVNITGANSTFQLGTGGTGGALNTSSAITIGSGGTFAVNQSDSVTQGTEFSGAAISGDGGFEQKGSGTTTLNVANTYTGGTTLNAGTLVLGNADAAGTGTITLSGGTLEIAAGIGNDISAEGNTAIVNNTGTLSFSGGAVTGAGTLAFSVAQQTRFFSALSGFSGTISHDNDAGGQLRLWNQAADLSATRIVTSGGTSGSGLQFIGVNAHTIGELSGTGGKIIMRGGSGLTLTIDQSTDTTYSGLLQDDGSRIGTLVKDGVGTLTLDGANTYSGTTTIDGGTLLVNNSTGSATGTGALTVNSGGTLGGTGTVSGLVTVNSGGHVSVDASETEISLTGGLTLNAGAVLDVDLSTYASGSTKVIVDYDGSLSGTFAVTNLTAGWTADIDYAHDQGGGDLAIALIGIRQYQTLTWDDGDGASDNWSSGANWVGDPVVGPVDGDSVVLTATPESRLDGAWSIVNGASLTSAATGFGDELVLQSDSDLTLATGGTMDIAFMRPRFSSGGQFTIEPGASLDTDNYGLGSTSATITFEANAGGVTVWNNMGQFQMGGDNLVVDLSNYDTANGTDLVLVDYNVAGDLGGQTFASVDVFGGLTGTLDYAYDQGGGDLAIAITGIGVPGTIFKFK